MATYSTPAIIIGRHNFGEADRIIVLLTPTRGVIRGVAKGVRKIKSRLAGHLELFSQSELMLAEGRNLDVITSARLVRRVSIGDDYQRMRLAYLFAEMVNRLAGDAEPHEGLFELLREAYGGLAGGGAADDAAASGGAARSTDALLELWFKLRLLDRLGYRPELGVCAVCHQPTSSHRRYAFNVELGGLVDVGYGTNAGNLPLTRDQIKLWRLALDRPLASLRRLVAGGGKGDQSGDKVEELAAASLPVCNAFYDYTFGKRFRSSEALM